MKSLMERKNWLGYVAALGLFSLVPGVLWSQSGGGADQDAFTLNVKAPSGTLHLWVDCYSISDRITIFCPPRAKNPGKKELFDWTGSYVKKIVQAWNGSTTIEVVMNMNNPNGGSNWDWNATVYPRGGKPFTVIRDPTMIVSTPPKVTSTGTIFQPKGGRSNAGKPSSRPGGGGKTPPRRRGYVTRIVTPTTSGTGNTMVLTPKSATTKGKGNSKQMPKVLFSGKGSITTHIRRLPTRSVRRVALRGGRP